MTKKALKEAVAKYQPIYANEGIDGLNDALQVDGVSEKDAAEIIAELTVAPAANYFEEWECMARNKKAEKIKQLRPKVKITEEQAMLLNTKAIKGENKQPVPIYFVPGTEDYPYNPEG